MLSFVFGKAGGGVQKVYHSFCFIRVPGSTSSNYREKKKNRQVKLSCIQREDRKQGKTCRCNRKQKKKIEPVKNFASGSNSRSFYYYFFLSIKFFKGHFLIFSTRLELLSFSTFQEWQIGSPTGILCSEAMKKKRKKKDTPWISLFPSIHQWDFAFPSISLFDFNSSSVPLFVTSF